MIDLQKDITLVLGVDAKTIEQLKLSWPTWKKHRPEMWNWPWIIFFDRDQLTLYAVANLCNEMLCQSETMFVEWPPPNCRVSYESQREKMLSGHVHVPAKFCCTTYHMKLDTDVLARPHSQWIDPQWFEPVPLDASRINAEIVGSAPPVYIAPRWNYTKGVDFLGKLEDWGDEAVPLFPRLGCRDWPNYSPTAMRVGHARMCSWVSYYLTTATKSLAKTLERTCGPYKLPVPSQDTTVWYAMERVMSAYRIVGQKGRGWSNHSRINELRRVAAEIMGA